MLDTPIREHAKPGLVRAWFDTVLNPLISDLRMEANVLDRGDYTWRMNVQRLASLVPVRSHVSAEAWDNLDQFLSVYPAVKAAMEEHDQKLQVLYEGVKAYYTALVELPELREILRPLQSGDEMAPYVAEYVVNNITQLPNYYGNAEFYNAHSSEFLTLREREVVPYWRSVKAAQGEFRSAVEDLVTTLATLRGELSFALDIPIVERVVR